MVLGGGAFKRRLNDKGGAIMNGIGALIKEIPEASSLLSPCEVKSKNKVVCEPRNGLSPDAGSATP